jgi:antitoxin CptB
MRELDVVLAAFLGNGFDRLDEIEIGLFEAVLDLQDPQLHAYLCGREQPADPALARLIERIRDSHTAVS